MNLLNRVLLDQFRVDAFIQAGGMGSVYRVWDLKRNAALAMKVLHADLAEDPLILARFQREANLLQSLAHPHIVPFYGLMQAEGFSFLLERFIDGPSLKELLAARRESPLSPAEALTYLKALCSALGYAHNSGVVHCDLKPANVLLDQGGSIYLTDFGIARFADTTATTLRSVGTPAYMAPEQITSRPVSPATDIYSLSVVLFEMLTGQKPFRGSEPVFDTLPNAGQSTAERVRYAHLFLPPPDPRSLTPAIPAQLAQVILIALSKDPSARFQSAQIFFNAACQAAGIAPESLPERVALSATALAAHAAGHPTQTAEAPASPQPGGLKPALQTTAGVAPDHSPPYPPPLTQAPDYSPPYPPPQAYYPYPPQAPAKKGLPVWAILLIALGGLALILLALAALNANPVATPAPEEARTPTETPQPPTRTPTPTQTPGIPPGPVTATPTPIQPTPNLPESIVRMVGGDMVPVYDQPVWSGEVLAYLPDGTRVWLTHMQSHDGSIVWAEVYFEDNGRFLPGWTPLDYIPGEPLRISTPTPVAAEGYLLAYAAGMDGEWQIYLNDTQGNEWALPNQPGNSGVPAWSPGREWLAFRSSASGKWQIYKIRPDGSQLTQLTSQGNNYEPNWSPDGQKIAFVSDRDGNKELYLMNADGSGQTRLTNNSVVDDDPSFSPDGGALVFESKRNNHMDLYWLALKAPADQVQVTSGGDYNGTPAWSPDGSYILFERGEDNETHLWMIDTANWGMAQFTFGGQTNHRPAWSADGNYVAYTSDESGKWQVHVYNFFDGISKPIGPNLSFDPAPGW